MLCCFELLSMSRFGAKLLRAKPANRLTFERTSQRYYVHMYDVIDQKL